MSFDINPYISGAGALAGFAQGQQNLAFQKEQFAYQKELQKQIFEREDNSVQRRAADLQKAGLSKTLAAGDSANAGSVVNTTAPQNDTMARVIEGISIAKAFSEAKQAEASASNEVKQGNLIDEQVKSQATNRAYTEARTLLTTGSYEMLGIQKQQAEAMISKANAETDSIMLGMGFTRAQIEKAKAETDYITAQTTSVNNTNSLFGLREENLKLQNEQLRLSNLGQGWSNKLSEARLIAQQNDNDAFSVRKELMEAQLAGQLLDNSRQRMENVYMNSFGQKMGTSTNSMWEKFFGSGEKGLAVAVGDKMYKWRGY